MYELEAVKLYRKAAEAGHDRAQCTLGYQIEHGQVRFPASSVAPLNVHSRELQRI